ncbi:MAG: class I SAM-dependent methyltransferase [Patescibacteria group bacterium]|nr:class I SAM-dependent methyltransferase [Patescibacteria group bacterium]
MKYDDLVQLGEETNDRYTQRLNKFGYDATSLGWDNKKNQMIRFDAALSLVNVDGKSVLDIGCGFGDLLDSIYESGKKPKGYTGVDINDDLLKVAKEKHPEAEFEVKNILLDPEYRKHDFVFMNGVLNFNLKNKGIDNYEYAKDFIEKTFALAEEGLVVDMLSSYLTPDYPPEEEYVFYYSPEEMFKFAQSLTPNVVLKHDYEPIPQREFMLLLRKI